MLHFLSLTLLPCILNVFFAGPSEAPQKKSIIPIAIGTDPITIKDAKPGATNIILQSNDGGQTWQDISTSLPENNEEPEGFFAGASDLYVRINNILYHSKSNLKTPVWEKENAPDVSDASIAFNRSGVMAYNYEGQVYQKMSSTGNWVPVYANAQKQLMRTIFETADGTLFVGSDHGLYKSADKGKTWKQVHEEGSMDIAESNGVLIATGQKGIMRSTDKGEHWQWVISEGGVGIAVERIAGGFAAISYSAKVKSRRIHISLDSGKTWQAIDDGLQPSLSLSSIKQMGNALLCGHPDGIFRSADMGKTWYIVHPGVDITELTLGIPDFRSNDKRKVFTIYASGTVLYAVASNSGC